MPQKKKTADYRFIDKDPAIDVVRTAYYDAGVSIDSVAAEARVSRTTIYNWLYGRVRRPQRWTVERVLGALGVEVVYLKGGRRFEARPGIEARFLKAGFRVVKGGRP